MYLLANRLCDDGLQEYARRSLVNCMVEHVGLGLNGDKCCKNGDCAFDGEDVDIYKFVYDNEETFDESVFELLKNTLAENINHHSSRANSYHHVEQILDSIPKLAREIAMVPFGQYPPRCCEDCQRPMRELRVRCKCDDWLDKCKSCRPHKYDITSQCVYCLHSITI